MVTSRSLRRRLGLRRAGNGFEQPGQPEWTCGMLHGLMPWGEGAKRRPRMTLGALPEGGDHDWSSVGTVAFDMACLGEVA